MDALAINDLPDDPELLKRLIIRQQNQLRELNLKLLQIAEERRLERAKRFGASSERSDHQYRLFDEAEAHAAETVDASADEAESNDVETVEVAAHTKRRPKRKPLPKDLPRIDIHHDLSEAEKVCGCCGDQMLKIGEQTSEQLEVIPVQVYVNVHHRPTYSCAKCDESIKTVRLPPQPIAKGNAGPGLLAHVATAKYVDGLPLYRQAKQFERLGIELPRNTLASHMIKVGELVQPLIERMNRHILSHDIVQMDETPVQVLKEPNKVARSRSYMWVMKGGPPGQPVVLFDYDPGRSQSVPKRLLPDYRGYLQTDGYKAYNAVLKSKEITGVGCMAHARRKFKDAQKALPGKAQDKGNRVTQALSFFAKLYAIEKDIKDLEPEEKQRCRQKRSKPLLVKFKAWLDKQSVPPKAKLGEAIAYTLGQWPRLLVYLEDGRLAIDNNAVERAIRPFAIGRRNWLFSATVDGVKASANLYSLVETAKANGINDYAYLKYLFTELPKLADGDLDRLLPWAVDRATLELQMHPNSQHVDR
jgi:transposase